LRAKSRLVATVTTPPPRTKLASRSEFPSAARSSNRLVGGSSAMLGRSATLSTAPSVNATARDLPGGASLRRTAS
jgi:hypothetical protein